MRHQRGEVLVAVVKRKRDLAILSEAWYRVPVSTAPRRWPPKWIAFYQGAQWGQERGVNYFAPVKQIRQCARRELSPMNFCVRNRTKPIFEIHLGSLQILDPPLLRRGRRVIVFVIPTTWQRFIAAMEINDLYDDSPLEDLLWAELKKARITCRATMACASEKEVILLGFRPILWQGEGERSKLMGTYGTLAVPTALLITGDKTLLPPQADVCCESIPTESREQMTSYCIRKVQDTVEELKGVTDDGLVPRRFYTAADGSTMPAIDFV